MCVCLFILECVCSKLVKLVISLSLSLLMNDLPRHAKSLLRSPHTPHPQEDCLGPHLAAIPMATHPNQEVSVPSASDILIS